MIHKLRLSAQILKKAKEFGADLVGITSVAELKECPSFTAAPKIPYAEKVGPKESKLNLERGKVAWPEDGKSVIVVALHHPEEKPELDWWYPRSSPEGNKKLINIVKELATWIEMDNEIKTYNIPYHTENGGIFLKDAAVMAGLGCIGKNNLLVSPEYGPRVRLRAMIVDTELTSTGPISFDPCSDCRGFCLEKCPTGALDEIIYTKEEIGQDNLPGRIGNYSRLKCNVQMEVAKAQNKNEMVFHTASEKMLQPVKYCRNCEFSCPIGK